MILQIRKSAIVRPYVRVSTSACSRVYVRMYERPNTDSETERYITLLNYIKNSMLATAKKNRTLEFNVAEKPNPQTREKKWAASN